MPLFPRRKRIWLLATLALLVIVGTSLWWIVTAKSEFERHFDRVTIGMSIQEACAVMESEMPTARSRVQFLPQAFAYAENGESAEFRLDRTERIMAKFFNRPATIERLRRLWTRTVGNNPPF
jgi:hypothetical protein